MVVSEKGVDEKFIKKLALIATVLISVDRMILAKSCFLVRRHRG